MRQSPAAAGAGGTTAIRQVLGDYEILEELGKGGMGVVYRARQISANRVVALKLIRADQLGGMTAEERRVWLERFRTEAQATARIEHPNVVTVHEVGMLGDSPYYSMRYIDGESLAAALRDGPVSNERAAAYLEPVARAAHAAHEHGIVHRDLKPSNILVDGADQPFVADFGLAKWLGAAADVTHTGQWLGTPSYMSPEQTRDASEVTPASDVYGLGATLYALLTGRPPFAAAHVADILYQVRHYDPATPRALNPAVHRDLETIALKCLSKDPGRRYPSAAALADELRRFRNREPILARPVAIWERAWLWIRRRPALAGLVFASLLALIASGGAAVAVVAYLVTDEARRGAETERSRAQSERTRAEQARRTIEQMNQALDQVLYVNRLQTVYRHWLDHDYGAARSLLDECPEPLRHWEWHYLRWLCEADRIPLAAPSVKAWAVAATRNQCATLGEDDTITISDAATGATIRTLHGRRRGAYDQTLAMSQDGKLVAAGGLDHTVKVWDVATGAELYTIEGERGAPRFLAFSPDGKHLATAGDDGVIRLRDSVAGTALRHLDLKKTAYPTSRIRCFAFSPDGTCLAVAPMTSMADSRHALTLWDVASGRGLRSFPDAGWPGSLAFTPDGRRLAASDVEGRVLTWDRDTDRPRLRLAAQTRSLQSLAFSPDGKRLAAAGGGLTVWDAETGQELRAIRRSEDVSHGWAAFAPDRGLITFAHDARKEGGFLVFHDVSIGRDSVALARPVKPLAGLETLARRYPAAAAVQAGHFGRVNGVAFSADGRFLASAGEDRTVRIWDVVKGELRRTLTGHQAPVTAVAYGSGGTLLATISDRTRVWDAATGELRRVLETRWPPRDLAFASDGLLAIVAVYGSVWDARNGAKLDLPNDSLYPSGGRVNDSPNCVALSPDGRWLAVGASHEFRLHDVTEGGTIAFTWDETDCVTRLAFSADGRRLATVGRMATIVWDTDPDAGMTDDDAHRILGGRVDHGFWSQWRPDRQAGLSSKYRRLLTRYRRKALCAIAAEGTSVALTPDGRRLAMTGADRNVAIWDAENGRQLFILAKQADAVTGVAFSPDGQFLATACADGTIKLWKGMRQ
jgi:WD40 repeat protein/predicted Ser/Thr protein kinase